MKRLNNRLLNSSCDESSVSKRTVSRWKKIFADSAKKKKIDDVLSDERSVVEQKCDRINSNFEQSTIIDDHITGDDNITAVDDDIDIYSDNKSICHDAAIDSSCSDIYSICSCCNDDISSDDELKVKPVENTDTEDIDSSDIEENTVASDGEEDSGQSTDEDKGERNDNSESDNTMSHQKKDEETDCDHEVETTEAVSNAAEEKLNQERSEHKDESELNNMSTQGEEKEKVTD